MDDQRQILTYALRTELGHDRLGRVFRALDARTMKPIVLRILRVGSLVPPEREEAVRTEVRRLMRAAANVAHPNLAPIVEIASHRDLDLIAWDDFGGVPLEERLDDGAPAVEVLRWAIETAGAIARAHSRDVPHGRLSLANIMVARDDGVRVLDLGVPRPKSIPYLVDDDPEDEGGAVRPARRDLPRLMRRDLEALSDLVQHMLEAGPGNAADAQIREQIAAAVRAACGSVLASPRPTVSQLHLALVDVARRTPADGRRTGGLREPPGRVAPAGAGPGAEVEPREPVRTESLPFSLTDYENTRAGGLRRADSPAEAPLRVWGAAAFDLRDREEPEVEEIVAFDPRDPPPMTAVLLPPLAPGERTVDDDDQDGQARPKLWPRLVIAAIIGVLLAAGLFALSRPAGGGRQTMQAPPLAARAASGVRGVERAGAPPSPRPVARPGQPSGTLVVTASQPDVRASVDGGPAVSVPVTWEDLPAGRRVVRVTSPGHAERVDTVDVRPNLTTTRYYILAPIR